jgi:hypothetical protein
MADTRMIFAVQTTDPKPTRLRIRGNVDTPNSVMTIRGRDGRSTVVRGDNSTWTLELAPGDYFIELQVEKWIPGRIEVTPELEAGQRAPIFVHGPPSGLVAVRGGALLIEDPKDPWPPPPPPPPLAASPTLAPDSATWFSEQWRAIRGRLSGPSVSRSM